MNKPIIVGTVISAIGAGTVGTMANYGWLDSGPQFADVLNVEPITETINTPRQQCRDVPVTRRQPAADQNQVAGTVIGAVVGGVLGKQIGGGNGKKLATIAGAAAGGYAGKKVQEDMQAKNTYTTTERRCDTVIDKQVNTVGYNVTYQFDGKTDTVRMDYKPGKTIPVVGGALILDQNAASTSPAQ